MISVSDTGPLDYLVLIDRVHLLEKLFDQVPVPNAVLAELANEGASEKVRRWVADLPSWVEVHDPIVPLASFRTDKAEFAAIALAQDLGLPLL